MSDATDQLARSRAAIVQQLTRRQGRERAPARAGAAESGDAAGSVRPTRGLWANLRRATQTWWRHHPAHLAVDLATPLLSDYARRQPGQWLGLSLLAGAGLALARPWRLISVTTLAVALLKSSHLPGLLMAAMSAADFQRDQEGPE